MEDYYGILGVSKSASKKEISDAYKKLAKKYHPDLNPGAGSDEKIKQINEAYEVLKDSKKRAQYDNLGHDNYKSAGNGGGAGGFSSWQSYSSHGGGSFEDIFDMFAGDLFGSRRGRGRRKDAKRDGAKIRCKVEISLEEALIGVEKEIHFYCDVECEDCGNTGSKTRKVEVCSNCNGSGVTIQSRGLFSVETSCGACSGSGYRISDPCNSCRGRGVVNKARKLRIKIPKGVQNGNIIGIAGKGESGANGGRAGDLDIIISIKSHSSFSVQGVDLYTNVEVDYPTVVLGGKIFFNSLGNEKIEIDIPKGTKNNTKVEVRGKGMPVSVNSNSRGALIVTIGVAVKSDISREEKEIICALRDLQNSQKERDGESFFSKIRKIW